MWRLTKTNSGLKQTNVLQGWARNSRKATERSFFFVGYGKIVEKENKMNQEGKFISHEEGPIKYIEISNAPKEDVKETAPSPPLPAFRLTFAVSTNINLL